MAVNFSRKGRILMGEIWRFSSSNHEPKWQQGGGDQEINPWGAEPRMFSTNMHNANIWLCSKNRTLFATCMQCVFILGHEHHQPATLKYCCRKHLYFKRRLIWIRWNTKLQIWVKMIWFDQNGPRLIYIQERQWWNTEWDHQGVYHPLAELIQDLLDYDHCVIYQLLIIFVMHVDMIAKYWSNVPPRDI